VTQHFAQVMSSYHASPQRHVNAQYHPVLQHYSANTHKIAASAPAHPHLALSRVYEYVDGKVFVNHRECTDFHKVSTSAIHAGLRAQRLENKKLLAKLHTDQKAFVKISKHYERKHAKLKQSVTAARSNSHKTRSQASLQSASIVQKLLSQHQSELQINQNETIRSQVTKGALWKGVTTNMRLVQEIHEHNKKIDCFRLLIANKSQQKSQNKSQLKQPSSDDHKQEPDTTTVMGVVSAAKRKSQPRCDDDDDGKEADDTAAAPRMTPRVLLDPRQMYAAQLVAKNKRYDEILALLRKKVDVLRAHRKNMI